MGNNNFLNSNEETEETTEEYLEEIVPSENPAAYEQDAATQVILSEAVKRIEHAKLYETLLNHQLFTPGSARKELVEQVEGEIKQFILSRLEILLGIKAAVVAPAESSIFSEDEITALRSIAGHLLKRNAVSSNPQMVPAGAPAPMLQQASLSQPTIRPAGSPQPQGMPIGAPRTQKVPRKKSANVSVKTGQDYSQARPTQAEAPNVPQPLPMPRQAIIDQMNAQQVYTRQRDMQTSGNFGKMLDAAVRLAQVQNRNEQ